MFDKVLPLTAILASLVAIGFAMNTCSGDDGENSSEASEELRRLESRLERMESRLNSIRKSGELAEGDPLIAAPINELDDDSSVADLRKRQQDLETYLSDLGIFEHFEALNGKVEESYKIALDPESDAKSRLKALGSLRKADRIDQAVVDSMVGMWQDALESDDKSGGWARWSIMENLEGINDPGFRDSILEWLPREENAKMRGQGVETLASMLPDRVIAQQLIEISNNDPEPRIRELASRIQESAAQQK